MNRMRWRCSAGARVSILERQCLRFALAIRGKQLRVETGHDVTNYILSEGDVLTIHHDGEVITLTAAEPEATRPTPPAVPEPNPEFAPAPLPQAV
jgi:alpha,alpha-trehalose phosphorylase